MCGITKAMNTTVSTAVTIVITVCMRMIRSKPITPPPMVSAATTSSATIFTTGPPPQPSCVNTVAVASVASTVRTVSQPTVSTQEIAVASQLPRTPNAARLRIIVGADPRLPATATKPQSRNEKTMPTTPAIAACQNEMPKPSVNEP